jgi:hypothetical protein
LHCTTVPLSTISHAVLHHNTTLNHKLSGTAQQYPSQSLAVFPCTTISHSTISCPALDNNTALNRQLPSNAQPFSSISSSVLHNSSILNHQFFCTAQQYHSVVQQCSTKPLSTINCPALHKNTTLNYWLSSKLAGLVVQSVMSATDVLQWMIARTPGRTLAIELQ